MSDRQTRRRMRDLLTDVLRAEAAEVDLQIDDQGDIVVCAMRRDATLYEVGRVSSAMALQDPEGAQFALGRIKFAAKAALMFPARNQPA